MAQRMESVAPPGGVMVSDSTARLVDSSAMLGEAELVHIKGATDPVPAHRLLGMATGRAIGQGRTDFRRTAVGDGCARRRSASGRSAATEASSAWSGRRESARAASCARLTARAKDLGVEVFSTYCESHATDVPFHAVAALLRPSPASTGSTLEAARSRVRERVSGADDEDLLLLDDLLGIRDPTAAVPQIDPDARRRRLAAMVNAAALARSTPGRLCHRGRALDRRRQRVDAGGFSVRRCPQTPSLVLITYRPEYGGALAHVRRGRRPSPLSRWMSRRCRLLVTELLGEDPSVAELAELIAERAAGNPFFAEEIVRDLSRARRARRRTRAATCARGPAADVHVPRTLQAVIAARIDRLDPAAKRTLNAAAVIGSRFAPDMLKALDSRHRCFDDLVAAELIDQTAFHPQPSTRSGIH